ncbi:hypothetical protein B0T14DRAFT_566764 [Immersiella caudata]|uniref:Uncharacterized protein n=1 Tax=Immersiella caudata TaxID=314043 RepID=A0AA40C085_9PEZI|nr:hypothetical protein B0T14DRAFT_566764 [Immersiella caudata]
MGKRSEKPTIRILLLGAPGVGKGCLESTFTTTTYPPLYDASLTINSRRFLTLSPSLGNQLAESSTTTATQALPRPSTPRRPRSASTTISNPASEHRTSADTPITPTATTIPPKLTLQTTHSLWPSAATNQPLTPTSPGAIPTSATTTTATPSTAIAETYLVEVTNYPALQNPKIRSSLLSKGDYDAVLLVYDITSRASFTAISSLHSEIPLIPKKRRRGSVRRSRSSIFGGGGHQRKGSDSTAAAARAEDIFFKGEGGNGGRETVVALVGNKCDVDAAEFGGGGEIDLGYPLVEKEAVLQAAEVEERSLVHPLFRRSVLAEDGNGLPPVVEVEPPLKSPRSVRSVPVARAPRMDAEDVARRTRSVVSERASVFSVAKRGSLNLVPEEQVAKSKVPSQRRRAVGVELPPTPPEAEAESAIQKWFLELEGNSRERGGKGGEEEEEVKIAKREVSKFEGEMLARTLLLNVPFRETSAKTGEHVEGIFEAIVREVLWEMGKEGGGSPLEWTPTEKEVKKQGERETPTLGRKRSVLKKDRKEDGRGDREPVRESVTSDLPPVLSLPEFNEERAEERNTNKVIVNETVEEAVGMLPETTTQQPPEAPLKQRRESFLGSFFKRVFMKKSAPVALAPPEVAS